MCTRHRRGRMRVLRSDLMDVDVTAVQRSSETADAAMAASIIQRAYRASVTYLRQAAVSRQHDATSGHGAADTRFHAVSSIYQGYCHAAERVHHEYPLGRTNRPAKLVAVA